MVSPTDFLVAVLTALVLGGVGGWWVRILVVNRRTDRRIREIMRGMRERGELEGVILPEVPSED